MNVAYLLVVHRFETSHLGRRMGRITWDSGRVPDA